MLDTKKICVVGAGKWGMNHIRTLHKMNCLSAVVESNEDTVQKLKTTYPKLSIFSSIDELTHCWTSDRVFTPRLSKAERDQAYSGWKEAVDRIRCN